MRTRNAFKYDVDKASRDSGLACTGGRTQQQFKTECDINEIVRRFGLGYEIPEGVKIPQYGDFTGLNSFHEALNAIADARENFELLPAHLRDRFQNDPGRFVDFATDEKNRAELRALGLLKEPPERTREDQAIPLPVPPASTPPEPAPAASGV